MINQQPFYDVTFDVATPDGQRFTTTTRILMHVEDRQLLSVGANVPVRYRPDRPGEVELVVDQGDPQTQAQISAARSAMWPQQGSAPGVQPGQHG